MQYNSAYYDDFTEFLDCDNQTANLLLDEFDLDHSDIGKYEWMNDQPTNRLSRRYRICNLRVNRWLVS